MRTLFILLLVIFFAGCNDKSSPNTHQQTPLDDTIVIKPEAISKDSMLLKITQQVLTAFKNKDYEILASLVHPDEGVRFSPYAFIRIKDDKVMTADWIKAQGKLSSQQKIMWGTTDANEEPIEKTFNGFVEEYIYDADFLHAHMISVNEFIGSGNTLNNLKEVYPGYQFTESHFTGFDKKLEGMDWKSLRLVFKMKDDRFYLAGVVHAQWSI